MVRLCFCSGSFCVRGGGMFCFKVLFRARVSFGLFLLRVICLGVRNMLGLVFLKQRVSFVLNVFLLFCLRGGRCLFRVCVFA